MVPESEWKWFGTPGHFICSHYCRFHLCTKVGSYLISTVGEHVPPEGVREITVRLRNVVLDGKGDHREADYLNKIGYEPMGAWLEGFSTEPKPVYETMVFRAGPVCTRPDCNCGLPEIDGSELGTERYAIRGDAANGHYRYCQEYANRE